MKQSSEVEAETDLKHLSIEEQDPMDIVDLPVELFSRILLLLPLTDLKNCSLVCQKWRQRIDSDLIVYDRWKLEFPTLKLSVDHNLISELRKALKAPNSLFSRRGLALFSKDHVLTKFPVIARGPADAMDKFIAALDQLQDKSWKSKAINLFRLKSKERFYLVDLESIVPGCSVPDIATKLKFPLAIWGYFSTIFNKTTEVHCANYHLRCLDSKLQDLPVETKLYWGHWLLRDLPPGCRYLAMRRGSYVFRLWMPWPSQLEMLVQKYFYNLEEEEAEERQRVEFECMFGEFGGHLEEEECDFCENDPDGLMHACGATERALLNGHYYDCL